VIVQDLLARASTLGIEGRIRLCGYRSVGPDLFSLYAEADAFVLSSDNAYEGLPRVLWEAMANSLPIVSTDIGSIGETLGDAVTLVPPGSAGGLARGIRRLLRDPARRRSQIALGLKLARANTLEAQVKLIANKLRSDLVRVGR
jgi:glycosyltransferase involved in cell wall biosynthesis